MNFPQMILLAMAVVSCQLVNGHRERRAPQYFPYNPHNIANDIHNHITSLTYDINNRVSAAANAAIANSLASSTYALNGPTGIRYPSNGGNGISSSGVAVSGGNRFSSGGSAFASIGSSGGSVRPTSSSLRPTSFRPTSNPVRQQSTFRPSPVRPVSVAVGSPNRFAAAGAGPLPGGGVSASAGAISVSG
ncbi:uncharacterized protein LOC124197758 isoform X2 [Daphnia pulex]|uniref:uncharacterized protein LOC124197758 isoform X2 n=1 Tax=Daphnia pulex TaxID=6669 RepID=UPI001EDCD07D|nr:uncharacterized protein LOC124197758 isoform X2 [Daphnia pulex]